MQKLPAQPNKSLIDGMAVLQELASRGRPVSGLELSSALGLEKTRVNRILKTLGWLGMVRTTVKRMYVAGEGMHLLAAQSIFASGLLRAAIPHLEKLHDTGLIVALGVLWRDRVSYFYHHSPGMSTVSGLGALGFYPAGGSSIGMALLSQRSELPAELPSGFNGTPEELKEHLEAIRRDGYAAVTGPENHCSLAMAVGNTFTAAAISGTMPPAQFPHYLDLLKQAVTAIDKDLHETSEASS